jgi:hypothetical protein
LNFFNVPALSLAGQSAAVYAGKLRHGWRLIVPHWPRLIRRFVLRRLIKRNR